MCKKLTHTPQESGMTRFLRNITENLVAKMPSSPQGRRTTVLRSHLPTTRMGRAFTVSNFHALASYVARGVWHAVEVAVQAHGVTG